MKQYLLLGSGMNHQKCIYIDGQEDFNDGNLTTLDIDPDMKPDVVHDLDQLPYPFEACQFDEIHAYECLEHCGTQGDGKFFFEQFAELWRILKAGGLLAISVPVWNSESAFAGPDHKRVLPPGIFGLLDPAYYANLGKPGYADYRKWLGSTNFEQVAAHTHDEGMRFFIALRAVK